MDQQKLRTLVFEKTGVKVDSNDPIFALVALNEAVLADTVERHVALIGAATRDLLAQAAAQGGHPPAATGPVTPAAAGTVTSAPLPVSPTLSPPLSPLPAPRDLRLLAASAGIAVLSALLVLGGQILFFTPAPALVPAPVVRAPALTPEQAEAIERGEKLARAVEKLDPKSRKLIEAEMEKKP